VIDAIRQAILGQLDDDRLVFVFPSDLAAKSWLEEGLRFGSQAALPNHRFLGWDNFKNRVFPGDEGLRPASQLLRLLFSRSLLAENARQPFLRHIIPAARAATSLNFVRYVAKALPALGGLPSSPASPLIGEWRQIRQRYAAFLADKQLYESGWQTRAAAAVPVNFLLLFPDLTDDWTEYQAAIQAMPNASCLLYGAWEIAALAAGSRPAIPATRFANVVSEVRAVLTAIRRAVAAGLHPAGILVSVADPDALWPLLRREAAVAGVPLDLRQARPLADSAGGRLLADLLEVAASQCSFASMRHLLLDRSRRFKDADSAMALMELAIDKHILAAIPDLGEDVWLATIERSRLPLRQLYSGIRDAARKLAKATNFKTVREIFDRFRHEYMEETELSPRQNDEIARCILVLDELTDTAAELGMTRLEDAAALWCQQLEDSLYLPVADNGAIAVQPFRVSAGCQPDLHFALNLSDQASRVLARGLKFLPEAERAALDYQERDLSEGLLRLLAGSGVQVCLSVSDEGPDGVRPAHPALNLTRPPSSAAELPAGQLAWDPAWWLPDGDPAEATEAFPLQRASAMAASLANAATDSDLAAGTPDSPTSLPAGLREVILARRQEDGRLKLSDSLIESYENCAFQCLFNRCLHIEAVDASLGFLDNLKLGSFYHAALQAVFQPLQAAAMRIVAAEAAGEAERPSPADLLVAFERAMAGFAAEHGPFAAVMAQAIKPLLIARLANSLACLRLVLDDCQPLYNDDQRFTTVLADQGVLLEGRPDLVCLLPASQAAPADGARRVKLVDYKKSAIPTTAELALDEDDQPQRLQIPIYLLLLEVAGLAVEEAWYLSIEQARPASGRAKAKGLGLAFYRAGGGTAPGGEDWPAIRQGVLDSCRRVAASLRAGSVSVPEYPDRQASCRNCPLPGLCRQHYTVR